MNKIFNKIKTIFGKRNNIFIFALSFFVTMFLSISLSSNTITAEKEFQNYASFPNNYSYLCGGDGEYETILKNDFNGLNHKKLRLLNPKLEISLNIEGADFLFVGVDANFENFPLPDFNKVLFSNSLEKLDIVSGYTIDQNDVIAKNKVIVMNQFYLDLCGYNGQTITIEGETFQLKGILNDSLAIEREYRTEDYQYYIPVYMPYTTLNYFYQSNEFYFENYVIETNNYVFPKYEDNEGAHLLSKHYYDLQKDNYISQLNNATIYIVLSLILLSFIATFILEYVMVRNKHNEIGIKRAIGARKDNIILEFLSEFCLTDLFACLLGTAFGICIMMMINLPYVVANASPILVFNYPYIFICVAIYYLFGFVAAFSSIGMGANVNISSIIVEER